MKTITLSKIEQTIFIKAIINYYLYYPFCTNPVCGLQR